MNILIEKNVMAPMRDGVMLATDVYRNVDGSSAPALVMRLPYDKERFITPDIMAMALAGYHIVLQDTRGRAASEGDFNANFQEINDGADCYDWVARQAWCNGSIGTFGQSYLGQVQWLAAPYMSAAVKAMSVSIAPISHYFDVAYRGGVINLGSMLFWCSMMALGERGRQLGQGRSSPQAMQAQSAAFGQLAQLYNTLPLTGMTHLQDVAPHQC